MTTLAQPTITIIGGGPSGMLSAISARQHHPDATIILIEKNDQLGKKMSISGGGRCNITNTCDVPTLITKIQTNPRFLYSALNNFDAQQLLHMLHQAGLKTKVEDHGRVFPQSDKATDVIKAFERQLGSVNLRYNTTVSAIAPTSEGFMVTTTRRNNGRTLTDTIPTHKLIIATGGLSANQTGATGDGYTFAQALGLPVSDTFLPAVVPLLTAEAWSKEALQGLSLRNVGITTKVGKKTVLTDRGDMLFAHFGVTGPAILRASAHIVGKHAERPKLLINLFPDSTDLDKDLQAVIAEKPNRQTKNSLEQLLPPKLIPVMLQLSDIPPDRINRDLTKAQRLQLVSHCQQLELTVTGDMGFNHAIATKGGVSVKAIKPATMESKAVPGLYIVGEVLDVNAYTGGYNLQIAYATGFAAGKDAALQLLTPTV